MIPILTTTECSGHILLKIKVRSPVTMFNFTKAL